MGQKKLDWLPIFGDHKMNLETIEIPCLAGNIASKLLVSIARLAQFLAVCRSVKTAGKCENLPPSTEQVARHQEMLSHADALAFTPALQRRPVPSLHPYTPVERPSAAMSALPERPHWPLGHVPVSTWLQTLLVSRLQAHLQRPHRDPAPPEPAITVALDARDISALSRLLVTAHCQRSGRPHPHQLSLVLVAPQSRAVL